MVITNNYIDDPYRTQLLQKNPSIIVIDHDDDQKPVVKRSSLPPIFDVDDDEEMHEPEL